MARLLFLLLATSFLLAAHGETESRPQPKLDEAGIRELGPEHLQLIYCGAKTMLSQIPENRKKLAAMVKDPASSKIFSGKGEVEARKMMDSTEKETRRIANSSSREFLRRTKKKISDGPCAAYAASMEPPKGAAQAACYAQYRRDLAAKLDSEVRSRAVASEFRERFRDTLAKDLAVAEQQLLEAIEIARTADAKFDITRCRFDQGIQYGS